MAESVGSIQYCERSIQRVERRVDQMKEISRRDFMKLAGVTAMVATMNGMKMVEGAAKTTIKLSSQAPTVGSTLVSKAAKGSTAKVYFTKKIDSASLIKLYDMVNAEIYGKVAIKLHTGEAHGPNILPRDMVKAFQEHIPNSNIVETNTMYEGDRDTTEKHRETLKINGWTFCDVDIMDADGDVSLPVRNGLHLKEVAMGKNIVNYDSMVVLTHFKGHNVGGYGGSLKNIAIGCASGKVGKRQVHEYHKQTPPGKNDWSQSMATKDLFMERMADSGKATCDFFGKHIVFLNVLRRLSVDCDCVGTRAAEPKIPDLGMMASTDILAIDQACVDLVYAQPEEYKHDLMSVWNHVTVLINLSQCKN